MNRSLSNRQVKKENLFTGIPEMEFRFLFGSMAIVEACDNGTRQSKEEMRRMMRQKMRRKEITLTWSRKIPIAEYDTHPLILETGLYVITRVWGEKCGNSRKESIVYIGKAGRTFRQRLDEHIGYWIPELRGNIYVRFAVVNADDDILEDLESALIFACQPQENVRKVRSYTFRTNALYRIINCGYRGVLPKMIDAAEQLEDTI